MNAKLLEDDVFTAQVQAAVETLESQNKLRYGVRWELFKQEIKMKALERAGVLKSTERSNEMLSRNNLRILLKEETKMPGAFKDDISCVKDKLE